MKKYFVHVFSMSENFCAFTMFNLLKHLLEVFLSKAFRLEGGERSDNYQ